MDHRTAESLDALDVGEVGFAERTDATDQRARGDGVALAVAVVADRPGSLLLVPGGLGDVGAEQGLVADAVFVGDGVDVAVDLGLVR